MTDRYGWAARGDINAFFGLVLDNIAGMVLIVSLLSGFGVPAEFALSHMIPGTAIGVLVGDLCFFYMAFRLASKTKNTNVTAMPLGLDTPSIFGIMLFVVGPAFLAAKAQMGDTQMAATHAWYIGIACLFMSGLFKVACSFGSSWARKTFPRAGLLGSLTAVALVLISFLPLLDVMAVPIVGMCALAIVLVTLVAKVEFPGKIPGTVAALLVGGTIYYLMRGLNWLADSHGGVPLELGQLPLGWLEAFSFGWLNVMAEAAGYLPIVIPFALATIVGGIDCTESAAAAGDHYPTNQVIGVEAFATLVAALCGGIAQTTPYIGHPAYKAMGGRAAYALATALAIGLLGVLGLFGYFYLYIPHPAVYPILIFIGLEITSQSFIATPQRHYPAVALACVPALALLSVHFVGQIFGDELMRTSQISLESLKNGMLKEQISTAKMLGNGFILTSLLWSSGLAMAIDRRLVTSAIFFATAGAMTLFGIIHSPLDSNAVFLPIGIPGIDSSWVLDPKLQGRVFQFAASYFVTAILLVIWDQIERPEPITEVDREKPLGH